MEEGVLLDVTEEFIISPTDPEAEDGEAQSVVHQLMVDAALMYLPDGASMALLCALGEKDKVLSGCIGCYEKAFLIALGLGQRDLAESIADKTLPEWGNEVIELAMEFNFPELAVTFLAKEFKPNPLTLLKVRSMVRGISAKEGVVKFMYNEINTAELQTAKALYAAEKNDISKMVKIRSRYPDIRWDSVFERALASSNYEFALVLAKMSSQEFQQDCISRAMSYDVPHLLAQLLNIVTFATSSQLQVFHGEVQIHLQSACSYGLCTNVQMLTLAYNTWILRPDYRNPLLAEKAIAALRKSGIPVTDIDMCRGASRDNSHMPYTQCNRLCLLNISIHRVLMSAEISVDRLAQLHDCGVFDGRVYSDQMDLIELCSCCKDVSILMWFSRTFGIEENSIKFLRMAVTKTNPATGEKGLCAEYIKRIAELCKAQIIPVTARALFARAIRSGEPECVRAIFPYVREHIENSEIHICALEAILDGKEKVAVEILSFIDCEKIRTLTSRDLREALSSFLNFPNPAVILPFIRIVDPALSGVIVENYVQAIKIHGLTNFWQTPESLEATCLFHATYNIPLEVIPPYPNYYSNTEWICSRYYVLTNCDYPTGP